MSLWLYQQKICYTVIELKTENFKPAYAEQINFYLSTVGGILKQTATTHLLACSCAKENDLAAEYSLKDMSKPIGVSEYRITSDLPTELERQLPSIEDIQKHIQ